MKPLTDEWVEKAEGDFRSAQRELRVRSHPNYDLVCFLSQQCAEKYLKGLLAEKDVRFAKTHDLEELLDLLLPGQPRLEALRDGLALLTDHAVEFRYPGETATKEIARTALAHCRAARKEVRRSLGLGRPPSTQLEWRVSEKRARYKTRRRRK